MNRIARLHRSHRRRRAELVGLVLEGAGEAAGGAATAEVRADIRMDVAAVLANLAEDYRTVIVLRELQHMSYNEIADVLGVPRGTVESRLFRARQKLKELLTDYRP